ncbi:MAG: helix-turn-helix domain-containing protein [Candidatus Paceibacterota bacterium]
METYISSKKELNDLIESAVDKAIQKNLPSAIQKASRQKWLTTSEVMDILQCSRPYVQNLRDSGQLPYRQYKRTIRYDFDEVEAFLNKGKVNSSKNES